MDLDVGRFESANSPARSSPTRAGGSPWISDINHGIDTLRSGRAIIDSFPNNSSRPHPKDSESLAELTRAVKMLSDGMDSQVQRMNIMDQELRLNRDIRNKNLKCQLAESQEHRMQTVEFQAVMQQQSLTMIDVQVQLDGFLKPFANVESRLAQLEARSTASTDGSSTDTKAQVDSILGLEKRIASVGQELEVFAARLQHSEALTIDKLKHYESTLKDFAPKGESHDTQLTNLWEALKKLRDHSESSEAFAADSVHRFKLELNNMANQAKNSSGSRDGSNLQSLSLRIDRIELSLQDIMQGASSHTEHTTSLLKINEAKTAQLQNSIQSHSMLACRVDGLAKRLDQLPCVVQLQNKVDSHEKCISSLHGAIQSTAPSDDHMLMSRTVERIVDRLDTLPDMTALQNTISSHDRHIDSLHRAVQSTAAPWEDYRRSAKIIEGIVERFDELPDIAALQNQIDMHEQHITSLHGAIHSKAATIDDNLPSARIVESIVERLDQFPDMKDLQNTLDSHERHITSLHGAIQITAAPSSDSVKSTATIERILTQLDRFPDPDELQEVLTQVNSQSRQILSLQRMGATIQEEPTSNVAITHINDRLDGIENHLVPRIEGIAEQIGQVLDAGDVLPHLEQISERVVDILDRANLLPDAAARLDKVTDELQVHDEAIRRLTQLALQQQHHVEADAVQIGTVAVELRTLLMKTVEKESMEDCGDAAESPKIVKVAATPPGPKYPIAKATPAAASTITKPTPAASGNENLAHTTPAPPSPDGTKQASGIENLASDMSQAEPEEALHPKREKLQLLPTKDIIDCRSRTMAKECNEVARYAEGLTHQMRSLKLTSKPPAQHVASIITSLDSLIGCVENAQKQGHSMEEGTPVPVVPSVAREFH